MITDRTKFIRWYVSPYNRLKKIPNGDGAFVALSMGFFLCERYYRIKSNTITQHSKTEPFLKKAAWDLDCDLKLFRHFWYLFRNGMQHQGQPKKKFRDFQFGGRTFRYRWMIGAEFGQRPSLCVNNGLRIIAINPWKFTRFMLTRFIQNPAILRRSISHSFGDIFPLPPGCRCSEKPY